MSFNYMWYCWEKFERKCNQNFPLLFGSLDPLLCRSHFQTSSTSNSTKIRHPRKKCQRFGLGVLQVSIFERLLLQRKAKIVKEVSVPASLTKQPLLMLASHTAFSMGWKWAEELQVRIVVLSQEELITVLKTLLSYPDSTQSVHFQASLRAIIILDWLITRL